MVFVWFMSRTNPFTSYAPSADDFIVCREPAPLPVVLDTSESFAGKVAVTRAFHNTVLFKRDRKGVGVGTSTHADYERTAYVRLKRDAPTPFVVDTYCRAQHAFSADEVRAQRTSGQHRGLLMERCVCTLGDVLSVDNLFSADMSLVPGRTRADIRSAFTWQIGRRMNGPDAVSDRPPYTNLSLCTAQRLLAHLRHPRHRIAHMLHLARAVKFMHDNGVVHMDLKPHNVMVRAVHATNTTVDTVQLVLGDFDFAAVYLRGQDGTVSWTEVNSDTQTRLGTRGYSPYLYHPLSSVRDVCLHLCESSSSILSTGARERIDAAYKNAHRHCHTADDIFGLGMLFLCMLHIADVTTSRALWIKCEMHACSPTCCPAHVMLYHEQVKQTTHGDVARYFDKQEQRRRRYEFAHARSDHVQKHLQLVNEVKDGSVDKRVCDLLLEMTSLSREQRPSIDACIRILNAVNVN
jgi:serine/threonine protein kinase